MSKKDYNNLIKALDDMNKCLFCVECHQFCKNPVTLSKCFHLICSEHFQDLSNCPKCKVSLNDCTTWSDDKLNDAVHAAKNLSAMFELSKENKPCDSVEESPGKAVNKISESLPDTPLLNEILAPKRTPAAKQDVLNNSTLSLASNISKSGKTVEKRNNKGETALHIACRMGKADKVAKLLSEGASTNTKDNAGWTPLHEVVQNGRQDLLKLLLRHNTLVNVPGQGNETPLHEAIRYNYIEIAKDLVAHGADINARNCKGETPLSLATPEIAAIMKDIAEKRFITEDTLDSDLIQKQIELDYEDIKVFCVSQSRSVTNKLKALTKHHSNLHVEQKFSNKVTHLIVDAEDGICDSSLEVLQGIVNNLWILTSKWVTASTDYNLASFEEYEVLGVSTTTYRGPKNARYNKYKLLPGIFNGCHFYFHSFNTKYKISDKIEVTKAILSKLVTDAGGIALRRAPNPESIPESEKLIPYHAQRDGKLYNCSHYIIYKDMYEPLYNMAHLKALPIGWLIECIEKYQLCEPW
ncbi:BRCA1-associated RING domain protein 1-like [Leguminivora glycinivorella]|uniref:BRCA1-associated RING domain protein 1-like n=1 Tax=Leguminivora glycinivorella TaxID=1035111 RepID=UPI0020103086|nr:BRCA1-associated RING domain protein 1-like [Leguminivora glycinivorella]